MSKTLLTTPTELELFDVIEALLNCTDLNVEDLDPTTEEALAFTYRVISKYEKTPQPTL